MIFNTKTHPLSGVGFSGQLPEDFFRFAIYVITSIIAHSDSGLLATRGRLNLQTQKSSGRKFSQGFVHAFVYFVPEIQGCLVGVCIKPLQP